MVALRDAQVQDMLPSSRGTGFVQQGLHPQADALRLLPVELSPQVVLCYFFLVMKDQVISFKMRIVILEVFSCYTSTSYAFTYLQRFWLFLIYFTFPYGSDLYVWKLGRPQNAEKNFHPQIFCRCTDYSVHEDMINVYKNMIITFMQWSTLFSVFYQLVFL